MLSHWNKSHRTAKEKVEDVEEDFRGYKEKISELFEVEGQALLCFKRLGSAIVTPVEEVSSRRQSRR